MGLTPQIVHTAMLLELRESVVVVLVEARAKPILGLMLTSADVQH